MKGQYLIIGSILILILITLIIVIWIIKRFESNYYKKRIKELEIQRNLIASTPVLLELSRVEPIIKNDKMEEKYNRWQDRFAYIKENRLTKIDDMLIDLDMAIDKRNYKSCNYRMASVEIEIYQVRESAQHLLHEIKDVTLSEEKYRSIVTKLKSRYRNVNTEFQNHRQLYNDVSESIELQLENIERRFLDFEKVMDSSDYTEVVHLIKALDEMIEHMEVIINEMPDVLLLARQVIPTKMKEAKDIYDKLVEEGYPLEYLNIEYNIEESHKNLEQILDRAKVLNLENCMFDLKTILDYYDAIFIDFENEKLSRKAYEELSIDFDIHVKKTNKLVSDVYAQLDDIKNMYDLDDQDVQIIDDVSKVLVIINDDYNKMLAKVESGSSPYSQVNEELEKLTVRLEEMDDSFDVALKSLGNMYEDEIRAREQLEEIKGILKDSKYKIRSIKLPVVTDNYFVELSEASESIEEVAKELQRTPIVIKTLNTRVDTARDLVLKLHNTTDTIINDAKYAEALLMYCNRFRSISGVNKMLDEAEEKFIKGEYKSAKEISINAISIVDKKLGEMFSKNIINE